MSFHQGERSRKIPGGHFLIRSNEQKLNFGGNMSDIIISGSFDWIQERPKKKGGKFYCSPFTLAFDISKSTLPSVRYLFKRLGDKEMSCKKNAPRFTKKLNEGSDVLDEVNIFTTKYLEKHIIDGQSPEKYLTWEFSSGFLWSLMYYKQSLKRYGVRPSERPSKYA